jgi:hypothetical protein
MTAVWRILDLDAPFRGLEGAPRRQTTKEE